MSKTTAARVRELRKALKLSLEKFANESDISFSLLSKAETGVVPVTDEMVEKIVNRWKVPFNWLSKGEGSLSFEKTIKTDNPYQDVLYNELRDQINFLRETVRSLTGGKGGSFRTALNQTGLSKGKRLRAAA